VTEQFGHRFDINPAAHQVCGKFVSKIMEAEWSAERLSNTSVRPGDGPALLTVRDIKHIFRRPRLPAEATEPRDWYGMIVDAALGRVGLIHSGDMSVTLGFPGVYAMHQIERPGMFPFPAEYSRLMLSGDGGYAGPFSGRSETDIDCEGRRGLSVEDARNLARMIDCV